MTLLPDLQQFERLASEGFNLIPVSREIAADLETPVSAFLKVARGDYSFLLESVRGGEKWGRYTFLGTEPAKVIRARGDRTMSWRGTVQLPPCSDRDCLGDRLQSFPKRASR